MCRNVKSLQTDPRLRCESIKSSIVYIMETECSNRFACTYNCWVGRWRFLFYYSRVYEDTKNVFAARSIEQVLLILYYCSTFLVMYTAYVNSTTKSHCYRFHGGPRIKLKINIYVIRWNDRTNAVLSAYYGESISCFTLIISCDLYVCICLNVPTRKILRKNRRSVRVWLRCMYDYKRKNKLFSHSLMQKKNRQDKI